MDYNQTDDLELVHQYCLLKNKSAFSKIYQRHVPMVFSVCLKYIENHQLAEDFTQEIFEKLLLNVCNYKIENFKAWLYMISKNHCLQYLRKNNSQRYTSEVSENLQDDINDLSEKQLREKKWELMENGIKNLSNEQKQCITLFFIEKYSYQEITDKTGWDFNKIKSLIQNAKRNLKIFIDSQNNDL